MGDETFKIWDGKLLVLAYYILLRMHQDLISSHHFTFDMGVLAELSRSYIWPRTDVAPFTGHSPRYFEIWATMN